MKSKLPNRPKSKRSRARTAMNPSKAIRIPKPTRMRQTSSLTLETGKTKTRATAMSRTPKTRETKAMTQTNKDSLGNLLVGMTAEILNLTAKVNQLQAEMHMGIPATKVNFAAERDRAEKILRMAESLRLELVREDSRPTPVTMENLETMLRMVGR